VHWRSHRNICFCAARCRHVRSRTTGQVSYAWFPPFRCRSAVAVSLSPLRKFRKNSVSAVRITLPTWKIPLRRCHLPLRRNRRSVAIGSNPNFCRSAVGGQPISVLVSSSLCIRKGVSSISGSYGTEERNGETPTEWWKPRQWHHTIPVSQWRKEGETNRSGRQSGGAATMGMIMAKLGLIRGASGIWRLLGAAKLQSGRRGRHKPPRFTPLGISQVNKSKKKLLRVRSLTSLYLWPISVVFVIFCLF